MASRLAQVFERKNSCIPGFTSLPIASAFLLCVVDRETVRQETGRKMRDRQGDGRQTGRRETDRETDREMGDWETGKETEDRETGYKQVDGRQEAETEDLARG